MKNYFKLRQKLFVSLFLMSILFACNTDENDFISEPTNQSENLGKSLGSEELPSSSFSELPPEVVDGFMWGTNGHPVSSPDYYNTSPFNNFFDTQLGLINELQGGIYRVNVYTNECGRVCGQFVNNCNFESCASCPAEPGSCAVEKARWDDFLARTNQTNIKLMVSVMTNGYVQLFDEYQQGQQSLANVYSFGYTKAGNFAASYGQYIDYYQLANEMHLFAILDDNFSGTMASHYDSSKIQFLAALFSGMQQGIRDEDPTAKTIVNSGGPRWYFFKALKTTFSYDYEPDILGWDWYKKYDSGNINEPFYAQGLPNETTIWAVLEEEFPDKDVWICEINIFDGTMEASEEIQSDWTESYINALDGHFNVKAHVNYELVDQLIYHGSISSGGTGKEEQRYYGIITRNGLGTTYSKKIGYTTYKYKIEEVNNGYEDYVHSLIEYINLDVPNGLSIEHWANKLRTDRNLEDLLDEFLPVKSYQRFVESQYDQLLDTQNPSSTGVDYWTTEMQNGATREHIISAFCNSTQFWNDAGGNNSGFVYLIFDRLLGHPPAQEGFDYWLGRLEDGMSRYDVANAMIHTEDYQRTFLIDQYDKVMRRVVPRFGNPVDYWFGRMQDGLSQQDIIIRFLRSQEYWKKGIIEGYERRTNLSFY